MEVINKGQTQTIKPSAGMVLVFRGTEHSVMVVSKGFPINEIKEIPKRG